MLYILDSFVRLPIISDVNSYSEGVIKNEYRKM